MIHVVFMLWVQLNDPNQTALVEYGPYTTYELCQKDAKVYKGYHTACIPEKR